MTPNSQLFLAAAQCTRRLRLGSSVSLVLRHPPVRIAEDDVVRPTHAGLTFHVGGLRQEKILQSLERFAHFVVPHTR